jgi:hypothetical protein
VGKPAGLSPDTYSTGSQRPTSPRRHAQPPTMSGHPGYASSPFIQTTDANAITRPLTHPPDSTGDPILTVDAPVVRNASQHFMLNPSVQVRGAAGSVPCGAVGTCGVVSGKFRDPARLWSPAVETSFQSARVPMATVPGHHGSGPARRRSRSCSSGPTGWSAGRPLCLVSRPSFQPVQGADVAATWTTRQRVWPFADAQSSRQ